jgi:predicted DNA-binding transcriptional regulator AlpA
MTERRNRIEERRSAHRGQARRQKAPVFDVRLTPDDLETLAHRVADLLRSAPKASVVSPPRRLLTAAEVAQWWGVERSWVYAHAEQLGARKIGSGERPRLRFDPDEVNERIAGLNGSRAGPGKGSARIAADSRKRSLSRRRRGIVVGQTDGRAAHTRPRPGAEGDASAR